MPRNSATNADIRDARNQLGARLRDMRRAAGLTGQQLADALSWPPSKVSKLEHASQTPSDDDVRAWCRATGSERETEGVLLALHTLQTRHQEWQRVMRAGLAQVQESVARREEDVRRFRSFQSTFVPGLLQTPDYARSRMEQNALVWGKRADIDEGVVARMRRQEVLYDGARSFHFVITEAVLLYTVCPPDVMLAQIDRLMSLSMLANVRLGIIPFGRPFTIAPTHGFALLDERLVTFETLSAELNLAQPQEIEHYGKVFDTMALAADYDRKLRAHLNRAAEQIEQARGESEKE